MKKEREEVCRQWQQLRDEITRMEETHKIQKVCIPHWRYNSTLEGFLVWFQNYLGILVTVFMAVSYKLWFIYIMKIVFTPVTNFLVYLLDNLNQVKF